MRRRLARTLRVIATKIDIPQRPSLQRHQEFINATLAYINHRTLAPPEDDAT